MTLRRLILLLCALVCLNSVSVLAETEEVYRFERLWPLLQQPWYFDSATDIAIDSQGNVYVADTFNRLVKKFTKDGHLIYQQRFYNDISIVPYKIAVDGDDNFYVLFRKRVINHEETSPKHYFFKKFSSHGKLLSDWENNEHIVSATSLNNIAVDTQNHVYITHNESAKRVIKKFTSEGHLLDKWPIAPLEYEVPSSEDNLLIAIGTREAFLYILDQGNNRVLKYTLNGELVKQWGTQGDEPGHFHFPAGIALDNQDNIYVADTQNHRMQKFTSQGELITIFATEESANAAQWQKIINEPPLGKLAQLLQNAVFMEIASQLIDLPPGKADDLLTNPLFALSFIQHKDSSLPENIALNPEDNRVYVSYSFPNGLIKTYNLEGELLTQWSSSGRNEKFNKPIDIARDKQGHLYITDLLNHRVVKTTADGHFLTAWGDLGKNEGQFLLPVGIALDSQDNVYVVDMGNFRIQKFSSEGHFIKQWGGFYDALLDFADNLSVLDFLFGDPEKQLMNLLNNKGCQENKCFFIPLHIAVDSQDHVYVVDSFRARINQFTADGEFIKAFGQRGKNDQSELSLPMSIAIDTQDNIYVTDFDKHHIKKFTTEGEFIAQWGSEGEGDGQFNNPYDIATDEEGYVYVSDAENQRIQKFTSDGQFMNLWGDFGTNPGQFNQPGGLTVSRNGDKVYATDLNNNRIQVFNRTLYDVGKAIIVAGGRDKDDTLWHATQVVSNFAYRALVYQGFTKNSIYYLNANDQLDLDNNGQADDVDAKPTKETLKHAITQWAQGSENLTIYLTDHGGDESFQLNGTEVLTAAELDEWLTTRQADMTGNIKIIYDACQSGSFLPHFVPPEGKNRIVITSSKANQNATFSDDGSLSFSGHFWSQVLYGANLENAFKQSDTAVSYLQQAQTEQTQTPQLESNGNNKANEPADYAQVRDKWIGNGTQTPRGAPEIQAVSAPQTIKETNTATITATVSDDKGIARVWALVRKPRELERTVIGETITALPSFELQPVIGAQYAGSYQGFYRAGRYEIALFALDNDGNISQPQTTTVLVKNALQRRAIIIGGDLPAAVQNVGPAYEALRYQGYRDNEIYYLSHTSRLGVDVSTSFYNVEFALTTWAQDNTQDLVIYLEGWGDDSVFRLNDTETVSFSQLDRWLDTLQQTITGAVTVIYQGPQSGHLIAALTPPTDKTRIVISSTGTEVFGCTQPDSLELFFSQHFWQAVFNGAKSIHAAFVIAKRETRAFLGQQPRWQNAQKVGYFPQFDDNGNGIGNEIDDGKIARQHSIGIGIITAGTEPLIHDVQVRPAQILTGNTQVTFQVENITSPETLNQVVAVIKPPCYSNEAAVTITLAPAGENRYQGDYEGFNSEGRYQVALYAEDSKGRRSLPKLIDIHQHWPLKPSQTVYQEGENIQVTLPSLLADSDQYLAVRVPDGSLWMITGLNTFMPFEAEAIPAWAGKTKFAVNHYPVTTALPKGEYQLYLLQLPRGTALELPPDPNSLRESGFYVE